MFNVASADSDWTKTESPDWIQIEIPSGWQEQSANNLDEDIATIKAVSPDKSSVLIYTLEKDIEDQTVDQLRQYQNSWMSARGYRICNTHPEKVTDADSFTSLNQVYVQGSKNAGVMYSINFPGSGTCHVGLIMKGSDAVSKYYESIPKSLEGHIIPTRE